MREWTKFISELGEFGRWDDDSDDEAGLSGAIVSCRGAADEKVVDKDSVVKKILWGRRAAGKKKQQEKEMMIAKKKMGGFDFEAGNKKDKKAGERHDGGVVDFLEQKVDGLKRDKGELEEDRDY